MESHTLPEPYNSLVINIRDDLLAAYGDRLVSLVVFGPVARGDARNNSDVDILPVIDALPKSRLERHKEFIDVERTLEADFDEKSGQGYPASLSPILLTPDEASKVSPLYLDMVEDAVIIYDKDRFFGHVLETVGNRLKEPGSKRVWIGKKWYWVLKPDYRFGDVIRIG